MEKSTVRLKITRPGRHSTTPLSARSAATTTRIGRVATRVMGLPKVADNSPRVASEKQHGTESENTCNFPIFDIFGRYIRKVIAPRSKHSGTPKLCEVSVLSTEVPPTSGNLHERAAHTRLPNVKEFIRRQLPTSGSQYIIYDGLGTRLLISSVSSTI